MKTIIISAFPGTGKSYFVTKHAVNTLVVDLDSNSFTNGHNEHGKVKSNEFPLNYIKAIEEQIGVAHILFVSIHQELRDVLVERGLDFTLVYPERSLKDEYLQRFSNRDDPQDFIELFANNWNPILRQLEDQRQCKHIVLKNHQYIADIIKDL